MIPVRQLYPAANVTPELLAANDKPVGDCWRTCVASIMNLEPAQVPHFVDDMLRHLDENGAVIPEYEMIATTAHWLREKGWEFKGYTWLDYTPIWPVNDEHLHIWQKHFEDYWDQPYAIACGQSPRSKLYQHCVVVDLRSMEVVCDPHPDNTGIDTITELWVIK